LAKDNCFWSCFFGLLRRDLNLCIGLKDVVCCWTKGSSKFNYWYQAICSGVCCTLSSHQQVASFAAHQTEQERVPWSCNNLSLSVSCARIG
jgi:hypothetical protein